MHRAAVRALNKVGKNYQLLLPTHFPARTSLQKIKSVLKSLLVLNCNQIRPKKFQHSNLSCMLWNFVPARLHVTALSVQPLLLPTQPKKKVSVDPKSGTGSTGAVS